MRTFHIPSEPSLADPAWMIALWERTGQSYTRYSNYQEVEKLIAACKQKQAENVGYMKAMDEVCEKFGVTSIVELFKQVERLRENE